MALDKLTPLAAPPGHSLTNDPGRWPWDRPPEHSDPDEAIDYIISRLDNPKSEDSLIKMMLAGITVEELVSQIAFKGFAAGSFNPDVAELIKPALAIYLLGVADENGIEAQLFLDDDDSPDMDDVSFFRILKQRNPELFAAMNEELNAQKRMQELSQTSMDAPVPQETEAQSDNFLGMMQQGAE